MHQAAEVRIGWKKRGMIAGAIVALAVAAASAVVPGAKASFPGTNGLVAFVQQNNAFVVDPANPVPTQITNTGNVTKVGYSADGNKLVLSGAFGLATVAPTAGAQLVVVPNTSQGDLNPDFDPTGTKLVAQRNAVLFTIGVDGTNRTNIGNGANPTWSADGTFIAFNDVNGTKILRSNPAGGQLVTLATRGPAGVLNCAPGRPCLSPTISPNSTKVVYSQIGLNQGGLAQVNADGSTATPTRLSQGVNDNFASYSPDATQVAFTRNAALSRVPTDGSGTVTAIGAIAPLNDTSWGIRPAVANPQPEPEAQSLAIGDATAAKGPCRFTVTRSGGTTGAVSASVAFSSADGVQIKSGAPTSVSLPDGQASAELVVKVSHKRAGTVAGTLSNAQGATISDASGNCSVSKKQR